MKIIQASNFVTRADLENEVRKYGLTPDKKEVTIKGTRAELARLQLSDKNVFWGIVCEITDTPTQPKIEAKVERGKLHAFGLNADNLKTDKLGAVKKVIKVNKKLKAKK